jgi:carbon monoxide dehydrogenase subunit G
MKRLYTTIDIEAPPDRIWATLSDVEHWSEWTPTVTSIRSLDPGPLAVGTRAIVRQTKLLPALWQVTEIEEGRSFTWIMGGPGILVTARHSIEGAANGSRATLSLDFSGPLGTIVARLTRGLNARYLALESQRLKKHAEAGSR